MLACSNCGREVSPGQRFCSGCGHSGSVAAAAKSRKSTSKIVTLVIAAAVGGFLVLVVIGIFLGYNAHTRYTAAQETTAIQQIKMIEVAETLYYSKFGKYATELDQIRDTIPAQLATGNSDGYIFTLKERPNGYALNVDPDGSDGRAPRRLYADETLVIRANDTVAVPATAASPELK